ncbi:MAG: hypothetical protein MHM6MM_001771 [Cercozoa sp. M6MM]
MSFGWQTMFATNEGLIVDLRQSKDFVSRPTTLFERFAYCSAEHNVKVMIKLSLPSNTFTTSKELEVGSCL